MNARHPRDALPNEPFVGQRDLKDTEKRRVFTTDPMPGTR